MASSAVKRDTCVPPEGVRWSEGQRVRGSKGHAEPIALLTVGDEEVLCMEESLSVLVLVLAKGL